MELEDAVRGLRALAHRSRLEVVRLLIRADGAGVSAGEIARVTGALPNTLSMNLKVLRGAGLVSSRRAGLSIIYSADCDRVSELLAFLVEECWGGDSAIWRALAASTRPAAGGLQKRERLASRTPPRRVQRRRARHAGRDRP